MEFEDVVRRRRMVRAFENRPIPPPVVERLVANLQRGPSAGHSQGWAFLVLDGTDDTERFWSATFTPEGRGAFRWQGLFNAPLIVVPCSHKDAYLDRYAEPDKGWSDRDESRWPVPYWDIDTGMAAMLLLLTAVDEGLGALFFGIFPPRLPAFRAAFGVPEPYTPIGAVAIGWAADGADEPSRSVNRGRRPVDEVVHRGRWREAPR